MLSRLKPTGFIVATLILIIVVSCSDTGSPTVTELTNGKYVHDITDGVCLGAFTIIPSEDLESAVIARGKRTQFDVTQWADVEILNAQWDDVLRTWTLTVKVSNPTPFTGWGVRAIFTDLGGKEMRWPDGYLWMDLNGNGDERYPFFAVEKTTENREFGELHSCTRDLVFHFPDGVDTWLPISFFIDAHLGSARPDPIVEDLEMGNFPPPCYHSTVIAHIDDHQSDLEDLTVWVDLSEVGGSATDPMYDDGEHDDGPADDGIYGCQFIGGNFGEVYTLTVYAEDPDGNTMENDVFFSPISYPPLPPLSFESLMKDQYCLLTEETLKVINNQADWETFWDEFSVWDMPAPEVDFATKQVVAVCIGQRDNDCYVVEVTGLDWSSENCGWKVSYTETQPDDDCECAEVITSPFDLVLVNQSAFDIMFEGTIEIEDCPDPQDDCLDLFDVASNSFGHQINQTMNLIKDQMTFDAWWLANANSSTPPTIDFENEMVVAVTQGVKNTGGYYPTVDSVCYDDLDKLEIVVGWHVPGPDCMVTMVITWPWAVYRCAKTDDEYYFTDYVDIYSCD